MDLTYEELSVDDGQLVVNHGRVSVEELRKQPLGGHVKLRALRRSSAKLGESLGGLGDLHSGILRVAAEVGERRVVPRDRNAVITLNWNPNRDALEQLHGRTFAESLDVWLRNKDRGEVLIEIRDLDEATAANTARIYSSYIDRLQQFSARSGTRTFTARRGESLSAGLPKMSARAPTLAERAAGRRQELAQQWLTASGVSELLGSRADNGSEMANKLRRGGQLLGVWVPSERGYRYPTWQFRNGEPEPLMPQILEVLRERGRMWTGDRRTSGWKEAEWFIAPNMLLDGWAPDALLARGEGKRVLEAAITQFEDETDAGGF